MRLLTERFETIDPGLGVEAMVLQAPRIERLAARQIAALDEDAAQVKLAELIDRLASRFGGRQLRRIIPVESDIPERSVARTSALAVAQGRSWPEALPRPSRLITPPEPIEFVLAEMPDHAPKRFAWRGGQHVVTHADGPERVCGEWWRGDGHYATRDYFQVELEAGGRYWLFRQGDGIHHQTGDMRWFIHGAFG